MINRSGSGYGTDVPGAKDWYGLMQVEHLPFVREIFCPTEKHMIFEEAGIYKRQIAAHEYLAKHTRGRWAKYARGMFVKALQEQLTMLMIRTIANDVIISRVLEAQKGIMDDLFGEAPPLDTKVH